MRLFVAVILLFVSTGCRHRFPLPYTTQQLINDSSRWPGDALVHYVGQPNADISVCSLTSPNTLHRTDEQLVEPFVAALEESKLPPDRWQGCATRLVPALAAPEREFAYGKLARVILTMLDADQSAPKLIAAHEVLAMRPQGPSPALEALLGRLNEWPRQRLAPSLPPVFDSLVATLELDHGLLAGKPITELEVSNTQDELLLSRMAARLPDVALRTSARRRLIRLRIDRSEVSEVRTRAAEVESALMSYGRWAQPVASLKLTRPELPLALPFLALVRQDVDAQVVTLLVAGDQLMPVLDLKPSLRFSVGWSKPLALCQPAAALAVEPCIDAREVEVANPMVKLDEEGVLRLPDRLGMGQAVDLARADEGLVLPVRLAGTLVTSLQVPLRFEAPGPIYFEGREGERGPAVNVVVQPTASALIFQTVSELGERKLAVLPRGAASSFAVASLGGKGVSGSTGRTGYSGSNGFSGQSASCPSMPAQSGGRGGDGGRGGEGGDGGNGGDGGMVSVVLQCGGACQADELWVRTLVSSRGGEGGDGGSGGNGGRGGSGGSGGSGTSCGNQYLSGGSSGPSGSDGPRGQDGSRGSEGRAGPVQFRLQ